jgi:hypothetical protein
VNDSYVAALAALTGLAVLIALAVVAGLAALVARAARRWAVRRDDLLINRIIRGEVPAGELGRLLAAWRKGAIR